MLDKFATSRIIGVIAANYPKIKSVYSPTNKIAIFKKNGFIDKEVIVGEVPQEEIKNLLKAALLRIESTNKFAEKLKLLSTTSPDVYYLQSITYISEISTKK